MQCAFAAILSFEDLHAEVTQISNLRPLRSMSCKHHDLPILLVVNNTNSALL